MIPNRQPQAPATATVADLPEPARYRPAAQAVGLFAGTVLVAFVLRIAITSISPLLPEISAELGLGSAGLSVLSALPAAAFSIFSFITPVLSRRVQPGVLLVWGMLASGIFMVLRAVTGSALIFILASLVTLAALGVANTLLPSLIKEYFPANIRAVTSAYIVALTLGTALSSPLAGPIADAADWRISVGIWSAVNLIAAVPWLLVLRSESGQPPGRHKEGIHPRISKADARSCRGLRYGLALMYGCTIAQVYAAFTWLPVYLVSAGMSRAESGTLLGLHSLAGLPLAIFVPMTVARMRNPFPVVAAWNLLFLGAYAGLLVSANHGTWIWVLLLGLAPAAFPLSMALIAARTYTAQETAYVSGFSQGIGFAIAGASPFIFGVVADSAGWAWAFGFLCALLPVQILGAFFACRPRLLVTNI
jgi:MFS transporter, CP family, cyanate transporter